MFLSGTWQRVYDALEKGGDIGANPQISTLSIVDPAIQSIIGSVDFTGMHTSLDFDPFGVVVSDDDKFAFVSGGFLSTEIVVIDISDPKSPIFETSIATDGGSAFGISLAEDMLFVTNPLATFPNSILTIVDVSTPTMLSVAAAVDPAGTLVDVATRAEGNRIITAITVNADFVDIPGTPPGGITVLKVE